MKRFTVLIFILLFSIAAFAQNRSRTTKRSTSTPSQTTAPQVAEIRTAAATKVADQVKILTRFLYLLGGVAQGIEQVDEAARKNEASPAALQQNEQNKATVTRSLRNVCEGLDNLETHFSANPGLHSYYRKLVGSAAGAATAEEQAAAGRFDESGRTLLGVVNRLTDVLLFMR
jgi:hypothetical protein